MAYFRFAPGRSLACLFLLAASVALLAGCAAAAPRPCNVIVMIGDGCGFNQIAATDLYDYGTTGTQPQERFPWRYAMSTYPIGSQYNPQRYWSDFGYSGKGGDPVTDSAPAATTMSTGRKTYDGAIGMIGSKKIDAKPGKHTIEYAEERGMATGVVTSVPWSHATPAGFVAHNISRNNYPAIAREMLTSSTVEVIMGCGHPCFNGAGEATDPTSASFKYVGGRETWEALRDGTLAVADADHDGQADDAWTFVETRAGVQALAGDPRPPRRVCVTAPASDTLQQGRPGDPKEPDMVPLLENEPTLAEMSKAALNVLSRHPDGRARGFFVMIEGGAIDWASHGNQAGRVIEETRAFGQAVQAVCDWVEAHGGWERNLLIVTADHETGQLSGEKGRWCAPVGQGQGNLPQMAFNSGGHTNSLVPFAARGPRVVGEHLAARAIHCDPVRGYYIDNTDLAQLCIETIKARQPLLYPRPVAAQ